MVLSRRRQIWKLSDESYLFHLVPPVVSVHGFYQLNAGMVSAINKYFNHFIVERTVEIKASFFNRFGRGVYGNFH
jgi:hypothetical protein